MWIVSSFLDWKLCCYTVNPYVYYSAYFVMLGHSNFWGWRFIRIFFWKSQWCKYGEESRMCVWKLWTLEWFSMHFYRYCLFFIFFVFEWVFKVWEAYWHLSCFWSFVFILKKMWNFVGCYLLLDIFEERKDKPGELECLAVFVYE